MAPHRSNCNDNNNNNNNFQLDTDPDPHHPSSQNKVQVKRTTNIDDTMLINILLESGESEDFGDIVYNKMK